MKATGIVRRIDDLGRVVIPKEIRRTLRIREGDPLEIFTNSDGGVVFKKYSLMGGLGEFSGQLCDALHKTTGRMVTITDRDACIAVAGPCRKALTDKSLSPALAQRMEDRQIYQLLLAEGDVLGAVVFLCDRDRPEVAETEYKLAQTIAGFLGRHMEG